METSEVPWYVSLVVSWLPFIFLLLCFMYLGRRLRRGLYTKDGRSLADVVAELTTEIKRRNDSLNR